VDCAFGGGCTALSHSRRNYSAPAAVLASACGFAVACRVSVRLRSGAWSWPARWCWSGIGLAGPSSRLRPLYFARQKRRDQFHGVGFFYTSRWGCL